MPTQTHNSAQHRIIIAGFGGQGVLTLGKLLCLAGIGEGKRVTYLPSYGSEVRGGTANCHVVLSPTEIFSPLVEAADSLIILNQQSFDRFSDLHRPGGLALVNTSLIDPAAYAASHDVQFVGIPATDLAVDMGNVLVANVILLGAFIRLTSLCSEENVEKALRQYLAGPKNKNVDINLAALAQGRASAENALEVG